MDVRGRSRRSFRERVGRVRAVCRDDSGRRNKFAPHIHVLICIYIYVISEQCFEGVTMLLRPLLLYNIMWPWRLITRLLFIVARRVRAASPRRSNVHIIFRPENVLNPREFVGRKKDPLRIFTRIFVPLFFFVVYHRYVIEVYRPLVKIKKY